MCYFPKWPKKTSTQKNPITMNVLTNVNVGSWQVTQIGPECFTFEAGSDSLLGKRESRHEVWPFGRGITSVTYNHHGHEALAKWDDPGGYRNGCLFLIRWLLSYIDLIEILLHPVIESIEECHSSRSSLDWKKRFLKRQQLEKQKKKLK